MPVFRPFLLWGTSVALAFSPHPAPAQSVIGHLLDADADTPISAAEIILIKVDNPEGQQVRSAVTDAEGAFYIVDVPVGRYRLTARRIGYLDVTTPEFDVVPGEPLPVEMRAAVSAVPLAPLEILARRPPLLNVQRLVSAGYYERQEDWGGEGLGLGVFLGPETLDKRPAFKVSDFLRDIRGVHVEGAGGNRQKITMRIQASLTGLGCDPSVYINGVQVRISEGESVDDLVSPSDVTAIEVYPGINKPGRFGNLENRPCGAIAIWTGGR